MTARPSYGGGYRPSYAELAGGQRLKLSAAKLPTISQPMILAADATTLLSVYRSVRTINSLETITLFSRVTLIRKPQKMARENFSIGAFYNITKNQDNPIKTVRRDSF